MWPGMSPLQTAVLLVLLISFATFVAFFGRLPVFRGTPISLLHRFLWIQFPNAVKWLDLRLTNGVLSTVGSRLCSYLLYEKHPLVVIFFLGLLSGSALLFMPSAWSSLPTKHRLAVFTLLPLPYLFTYLSARRKSSPFITPSNHAECMRQYPYDRILYYPGHICRTCNLLKPARSKHCSVCKACVARHDHHCIWVNNCLGKGNYRWFLLLLLFTGIVLAYGAFLAHFVLAPQVKAHFNRYASYYDEIYKVEDSSTKKERIRVWFSGLSDSLNVYMQIGGVSIAGVGLLALFTWPMPFGLLGYHCYLIWAGMTTNESSKWSDWREDMHDGAVFLASLKSEQHRKLDPFTEPLTSWPIYSRQALCRTDNGQPPNWLPKSLEGVVQEDTWKRCWRLAEVENLYDLGFWDNLIEALR